MTALPPAPWSVDYEECGLNELWVYKFDKEPVADATWRRLNAKSGAHYRIIEDRLQLLGPREGVEQSHFNQLLASFCEIRPLYPENTLETVIKNGPDGLRISEKEATTSVAVLSLTTAGLRAAYDELSSNPNRWK